MQLCSRRRVCCRLVVRAPTGVDAIAIYAGQQPQLAADDAGASVHKGTSFFTSTKQLYASDAALCTRAQRIAAMSVF